MPKPGNRAANRLVIRFVTARLKAAAHRLRNRISRIGASRIARSRTTARVIGMAAIDPIPSSRPRPAFLYNGDVRGRRFPAVVENPLKLARAELTRESP